MTLADRIDALLPQTQCGQCGYPGCRPYAEAIARGEASINQCPPGGAAGIAKLADLLHRTVVPLNPANGIEHPRMLAHVVETDCIGCTKCIQACPVDAIIGAAQLMHAVVAEDCTGCELCVAACPVDCIELLPMSPEQVRDLASANAAREHFQRREARLQRDYDERAAELAARKAAVDGAASRNPVQEALARALARQKAHRP